MFVAVILRIAWRGSSESNIPLVEERTIKSTWSGPYIRQIDFQHNSNVVVIFYKYNEKQQKNRL